MDDKKNLNQTDTGFELDKIDTASLLQSIKPAPDHAPNDAPGTPSEVIEPTPTPGVKAAARPAVSSKSKLIMIGASVLVVSVTALFLVFGNQFDINFSFSKKNDYAKPETYISVGPVISTVGSGDLIKMTLDINCAKKSYRKKVAKLDTKIQNRVMWSLQTQEAEKFLAAGDYESLRKFLTASVMEIIPKGTVTEIYFSEFLRY